MKKNTLLIALAFVANLPIFGQISMPKVHKFYKPAENPILKADSNYTFFCPVKKEIVKWQRADVFNPAAIVRDNKVYVLYRCEDNPAAALGGRTSRIGLAESTDGIHFTKHKEPVLFPTDDEFKEQDFPGGCEDPRIVETEGGQYVVMYTSWNNKVPRLSVAFSTDLVHWEKKGLAFAKAHGGKFSEKHSKSASIITAFKNNKQVAVKIKGKYWMYWGEHFVNLAWSEDLYNWTPLLDEKGDLKRVFSPRPQHFDSHLTECGPPAIITKKGILLMYNGRNATDETCDPNLPKGIYTVSYALMDKNDPEKVIERPETFFLKPTLPHEITGQYSAGTTFAEGLVYFKKKWFLYYGTADSFVGLAIAK
jgi:beta-1,2-mannosidase